LIDTITLPAVFAKTPPRGRRPHSTCGGNRKGVGKGNVKGCSRRSMGLSSGGILMCMCASIVNCFHFRGAQAEHQPSGVDLTRPGRPQTRQIQYQNPTPQGGLGGRLPPRGGRGSTVTSRRSERKRGSFLASAMCVHRGSQSSHRADTVSPTGGVALVVSQPKRGRLLSRLSRASLGAVGDQRHSSCHQPVGRLASRCEHPLAVDHEARALELRLLPRCVGGEESGPQRPVLRLLVVTEDVEDVGRHAAVQLVAEAHDGVRLGVRRHGDEHTQCSTCSTSPRCGTTPPMPPTPGLALRNDADTMPSAADA
jgi:hypothetical protein